MVSWLKSNARAEIRSIAAVTVFFHGEEAEKKQMHYAPNRGDCLRAQARAAIRMTLRAGERQSFVESNLWPFPATLPERTCNAEVIHESRLASLLPHCRPPTKLIDSARNLKLPTTLG